MNTYYRNIRLARETELRAHNLLARMTAKYGPIDRTTTRAILARTGLPLRPYVARSR